MAEQNIHNTISEVNPNNFWLTCPPPLLKPTQSMTPAYNLDYRASFVHPYVPSYNKSKERNPISFPFNYIMNNLNYQDQYAPLNQSVNNSFSSLPENIDQEYILKYLCPEQKVQKDETNLWIENWLVTKGGKQITIQMNVNSTNQEIHEISNKVKECKLLLENIGNNKQLMEQNILTMSETEWKKSCENVFTVKEQINTLIKTFNLDNNSISDLKLKLAKRKKKRDRLKRRNSNLKMIKSQQKDEILEINRKIDTWQNTLKENILKEKRVNKTKIEANIVLKGVRGKIDDAKNQLSLLDTLEKLRKYRLQNCVNKRKNPLLEESLNELKILWHKKLMDYNKEEDELKIMLSKDEAKKHKKREVELQEKLVAWDQIIFGPDFKSHDVIFNNLHTFLNIRKDWDEYVVDHEVPNSSSIPVGWILPTVPCNSDWASYSNHINEL